LFLLSDQHETRFGRRAIENIPRAIPFEGRAISVCMDLSQAIPSIGPLSAVQEQF
jgi:hypothetical protein